MKKLSGLFTALVTPFIHDQVDLQGLESNIEYQIENRVDGILVLGSTGEASTLSFAQKDLIIQKARSIAWNTTLMVGVGSPCTRTTIENCLHAADLGADYLLVVCPYYNKPTQEGLFRHFEAIAAKTAIPIIIYNAPSRTSITMEPSTLERLASLPMIAGFKECSSSLYPLTEMIAQVALKRPDFSFLAGDDLNVFSSLLLGADGLISVASNLIPASMQQLLLALKRGRSLRQKPDIMRSFPFSRPFF